MSILNKFFERKGIDPSTLSSDEKATMEQWKVTLEAKEVTVDTILDFCTQNIKHIEGQFRDVTIMEDKLKRLTLLHSVYSTLRDLIKAPVEQREQFEKYLSTLLQK